MAASGQIRDPFPTVLSAGKSVPVYQDSTGRNLQPDVFFPAPSTPTGQTKFRKNYNPGEIVKHHGMQELPLPGPSHAYGNPTPRGEDVAQTFVAGQKFGVAEYLISRGESIYDSAKREPLGKSYVRGHKLPATTEAPEFHGFGKKAGPVQDGKEVLFPRGVLPESEGAHKNYVKTHGNFAPGEMFVRKYDWPKEVTDNPHFRFGVAEYSGAGRKGNGAKSALNMEAEEDGSMPTTRIVQRTSEDYRHVASDHLAAAKNMMQGKPPVPADHAYGIRTMGTDITAGEALRGQYQMHEQMPDHDLSVCKVPGRSNLWHDDDRIFGVPSVRVDLAAPHPHRRSVADTMNYGDEVGAHALLSPQRFELQGVPDNEFLLRRDKNELKSIVVGAGYKFEDADFDSLFEKALALFEDDKAYVSLDAFMFVYSDWINANVRENHGAL
jgi:hypothetical protein